MLNVEKLVIKNYKEYLEEEELKHSEETLKTYISGLYYELLDNIDVECENFSVPSELDSIQAVEYVESEIERIIKDYYKREDNMNKEKVYILYENYYGELVADTGESSTIIGIYKDIDQAKEKAKQLMNSDLENNYILDKDRDKENDTYYLLFWNNQDNWSCYYEIIIEERGVE